jgi:hypothetical protein
MPGLTFSGANLATVAYAEVSEGGTSSVTNSGITTTRTSRGIYFAMLPTAIAQVGSKDLIFVQPKLASGVLAAAMAIVDDTAIVTKVIRIFDGNTANSASTGIDCDFSLLILRTTISPPAGSPG